MTDATTVFALSSGQGRAGVAVIRVTGPRAGRVLETMAGGCPEPRRAALRRVRHPVSGEVLDAALVLWFPGPASETGEDLAELQVHGGRAVVRAVLAALGAVAGCRLAEPGAFARRAFENGKLDLTQAEGLADLIEAETEGQRRQALVQAGGAQARVYDGWRARLLEARALLEAGLDFSDEADVAADCLAGAVAAARGLRDEIAAHLADGHRGELMRDGFQVVIAGAANVGKSSLFNALVRREASIVSPEAGTTRDVVEVRLDLEGLPIVLSDTAGLRDGAGAVEAEGIRRARGRTELADLVVWVTAADAEGGLLFASDATPPPDPGHDFSPQSEKSCRIFLPPQAGGENRALRVVAKVDLVAGWEKNGAGGGADVIGVSVVTGAGLAELTRRIAGIARDRMGGREAAVITQERHRVHLAACRVALDGVVQGDPAAEIAAEDLRRAADELGRITGRVDAEDVLGAIFGRFCIGK